MLEIILSLEQKLYSGLLILCFLMVSGVWYLESAYSFTLFYETTGYVWFMLIGITWFCIGQLIWISHRINKKIVASLPITSGVSEDQK